MIKSLIKINELFNVSAPQITKMLSSASKKAQDIVFVEGIIPYDTIKKIKQEYTPYTKNNAIRILSNCFYQEVMTGADPEETKQKMIEQLERSSKINDKFVRRFQMTPNDELLKRDW